MAARESRRILRLRVTVEGTEPEIWRTIDIDDSLTLDQLHMVLQIAFGWFDSHLHRFSDGDPWERSNGIPRIGRQPRAWVDSWSLNDLDFDAGTDEDEARTTVGEAMQHDGPLWYVYDFGDNWMHRIDLIDRDAARAGEPLARIIIGERRGPLENSGGVGGHHEAAGILADPTHAEHVSMTQWALSAAGPWGNADLDDADVEGANGELAALFGPASAELSGLVDAATGVTADSPIAEFAAGLAVPLRANLRRHLRRSGVLEPRALGGDEVAAAVAPFSWLIDRLGTEGLTLTKAGWMPPAVVLEGMTTLGWRDNWIGEANREDLTYPMRVLRESAQQLRLIRKVKGRLELVARTRAAIAKPEVMADLVARMLLRQRMTPGQRIASTVLVLGLADGTITTRRDASRQVIGVLGELGYAAADGTALDERWFTSLAAPALDVFDALGLWRLNRRRRDVPPTEAIRAIARRALR